MLRQSPNTNAAIIKGLITNNSEKSASDLRTFLLTLDLEQVIELFPVNDTSTLCFAIGKWMELYKKFCVAKTNDTFFTEEDHAELDNICAIIRTLVAFSGTNTEAENILNSFLKSLRDITLFPTHKHDISIYVGCESNGYHLTQAIKEILLSKEVREDIKTQQRYGLIVREMIIAKLNPRLPVRFFLMQEIEKFGVNPVPENVRTNKSEEDILPHSSASSPSASTRVSHSSASHFNSSRSTETPSIVKRGSEIIGRAYSRLTSIKSTV